MTIKIVGLNFPIILLSFLIPLLIIIIFLQFYVRDKDKRNNIVNKISNMLFFSFIIWKTTPLIFSYKTILLNPSSFLFMTGGFYGELFAIIFSTIYLIIIFFKNKKNKLLILISSIMLVLSSILLLTFNSIEPQFISEKDKIDMEELVIYNRDNMEVNINFNSDKPIIINFWATWCPPCKAELPELIEFYRSYGTEVNFYGVNLINTEKVQIDSFIDLYEINFPIYYDSRNELSEYFDIETIPTTIIIKKIDDKMYLEKISGVVSLESLKQILR